MLKALLAVTLAMQITTTLAREPATYVCVEERSVGWEPRDGQPDAVGQFSPDPSPFIVKFRPPATKDGMISFVGRIEVTEEGNTYTYTSNECPLLADLVSDRAFGADSDVDRYLKLQYGHRNVGFGVNTIRYQFSADLGERQTPIMFQQSSMVAIGWAYLNMGTCTLAD